MNFGETVLFAVVVGIIATPGVMASAWINLRGVQKQLEFNHAAKIAEFR